MGKPQANKSLRKGRPPLSKPQSSSLSAKTTRTLIRSHHRLRKAHATALAASDTTKAERIESEIKASGGLQSYQLASTIGQSTDRGGDSSKILVEWLRPDFDAAQVSGCRLRILEVGALSTKNACSLVPCVDIERIDLHSRDAGIREIDFMDLPVPFTDDAKFNIISLSLVLNFVPDTVGRGDMLKRVPGFFQRSSKTWPASFFFLVLPLPCVQNSRYLSEGVLALMMQSLGMVPRNVKKSSKLHYSLWKYEGPSGAEPKVFKKGKARPGKDRNNFAIELT